MTDLSFVVPAYNESQRIGATLTAILEAARSTGLEWEVLVTDNASTDATAAIALAAGARVVPEPFRQIARSRNRGASEATGKYLIFVDADTLVSVPLVRAAVKALASGKAVGGGSLLKLLGAGPLLRAVVAPWNLISRRMGLAAGSFLFCLREAWQATGGFDERYFASEELWFSRALKRWGRARGLPFIILADHPVETSARRLEGRAIFRFGLQFLVLNLCPWLLRSRRACFLWYRR